MQVFLQIVAFSLQTDGSGRPVLTKGKRPKSWQRSGRVVNAFGCPRLYATNFIHVGMC